MAKEKITIVIVTHDIDEAVYLGNRVVVMTSRPGRIRKIEDVHIVNPRQTTGTNFQNIKEKIYKEFFADNDTQFSYNI